MTAARAVLRTERLRLEPVGAHHAGALFEAVIESRLELLPWMPWARDPSLEGNRHAAEDDERAWREDRRFSFVMIEQAAAQVIGVVGLDREPTTAQSGLFLRDVAGRADDGVPARPGPYRAPTCFLTG